MLFKEIEEFLNTLVKGSPNMIVFEPTTTAMITSFRIKEKITINQRESQRLQS